MFQCRRSVQSGLLRIGIDLLRRRPSRLRLCHWHADASGPASTDRLRGLRPRTPGLFQCDHRQRSQGLHWQGGLFPGPTYSDELEHRRVDGLLGVPGLAAREHTIGHDCAGDAVGGASDRGVICGTCLLYGVPNDACAEAVVLVYERIQKHLQVWYKKLHDVLGGIPAAT